MSEKHKIADGIYRVDTDDMVLDTGAWKTSGAIAAYLVESQAKLDDIPDAGPGDFAFTAGFKKMWQLGTDGQTWVDI